jgi:hypothetical protein
MANRALSCHHAGNVGTAFDSLASLLRRAVERLDHRLVGVSRRVQYAVVALTAVSMTWQALPWVPQPVIDYSRVPLLRSIPQPATYGTDTIADAYEARVVLHDPRDMYVKREVPQTPEEARTWSKPASAPYPPAVLLVEAALLRLAGGSRRGFYLAILGLAVVFMALSLRYFLRTRWYLFPLLYLNFTYIGQRLVSVQDGSYVVMLVTVVLALVIARTRRALADALMAVAITMKLSPLFYLVEIPRMRLRAAVVFIAILVTGFLLPCVFLENYLYIYGFAATLKGSAATRVAAAAATVPFAAVLWYIEARRSFDLEERIGWALVPGALYFAIRMNVARHLLLVLLVPDKRAWRNVAAALALGLYTIFPRVIRLGSTIPIATVVLVGALAANLYAIGWKTMRSDLRHPLRVVRLLTGHTSPVSA